MIQTHQITGGGGVVLHVTDQGPKDAPALLLIHGWSQNHACWQAQAPLAETHRLISFDLRGHGASDVPTDAAAYTDTALWADDVKAIIGGLDLKKPLLVGWSYGARVIASYLQENGDEAISGVVLVGGILAIGRAREDWMVGPSGVTQNKDLVSDDDTLRRAATIEFLHACTVEPLEDDLFEALLNDNMKVAPHVRHALFSADWDLQPTLTKLSKPAFVIHGVEDDIVPPIVGITASEIIPNCELSLFENSGHAPFIEQTERFNTELAQFATLAFGAAA